MADRPRCCRCRLPAGSLRNCWRGSPSNWASTPRRSIPAPPGAIGSGGNSRPDWKNSQIRTARRCWCWKSPSLPTSCSWRRLFAPCSASPREGTRPSASSVLVLPSWRRNSPGSRHFTTASPRGPCCRRSLWKTPQATSRIACKWPPRHRAAPGPARPTLRRCSPESRAGNCRTTRRGPSPPRPWRPPIV